jgi:endoglucanase
MGLTINVSGGTAITQTETISPGSFAVGVNLDGMEYGTAGAVQNVNYVVPAFSELQYYKSQGTDLIRLPISWETLQTKLGGALTASYLANIKTVLSEAASLGMKVIIDLHNFGSYNGVKLGTNVTDADFADLWKKLATAVAGSAGLGGYDLMNEPNNMPAATSWTNAAQAAITAIRTADSKTPIYVEGNNYASAYNWSSINPGLATLVDPSHNLVFSAHVYLDSDDSGTHFDWAQQAKLGTTTQTGASRLQNFVAWLKQYHLKGDVGEIGVGNDNSAWLTGLDTTLAYAKANNLQTTYWAGGAWWGSYPMSVEPQNGVRAAQTAILDKYSGNYEKISVAKVTGTASANATVYLSQNDVLLATVKAGASGSWSYTFTDLPNGVHTIVAGTTKPTVDGTIAAVTFDLAAVTSASIGAATPKMHFIAMPESKTASVAVATPARLNASTFDLATQPPAPDPHIYFKTAMATPLHFETSLLAPGSSAYITESLHIHGVLAAMINHAQGVA